MQLLRLIPLMLAIGIVWSCKGDASRVSADKALDDFYEAVSTCDAARIEEMVEDQAFRGLPASQLAAYVHDRCSVRGPLRMKRVLGVIERHIVGVPTRDCVVYGVSAQYESGTYTEDVNLCAPRGQRWKVRRYEPGW